MSEKRQYVGVETRPCEKCGTGVTRKHSAFKDHTFCSRTCYLSSDYLISRREASNAVRYAGKRETRPCRQCGAGVERPVSQFHAETFCSQACRSGYFRDRTHQKTNSNGYTVVFVGKGYPGADKQGQILEHRKVMQEVLGRALVGDENVHHMNGVKHDNRPENLELWSKSQPCGQRVTDKIEWARSFLALYENLDK